MKSAINSEVKSIEKAIHYPSLSALATRHTRLSVVAYRFISVLELCEIYKVTISSNAVAKRATWLFEVN